MTERAVPSSRAGIPGRVWNWQPASQTVSMALFVTLFAVMTVFLAGTARFVLAGLILRGLEVAFGGVLLAELSPQIMLRADLIRIWHGVKFTNIGISQIAGIGMLYIHTPGYGGYWQLIIWRDDESIETTEVLYLRGKRPRLASGKGPRWVRQANYDPVAASQIPALDASRAARVGRDIYQRVLAAQGPGGQLAARHLESHRHPVRLRQYEQVIAYWSPDGQTGRCH